MRPVDWILLVIIIILVVLQIVSTILILKKNDNANNDKELSELKNDILNGVNSYFSIFQEVLKNTNEMTTKLQNEKIELLINTVTSNLKNSSENQSKSNVELEQKLENIRQTVENSLAKSTISTEQKLENIRQTVENNLNKSTINTDQKLENIRTSVENNLNKSTVNTEQKLENIRLTVEKSITRLQDENSKKLDEMRNTVDEKLQKTLEDRISRSFQLVSERLEQVYKGLGEMQNLASGVGDLKKVLSNVKTRGILGEIQLGNILEEILTTEQYVMNYATKKGSKDRVEFAIKLPGDDEAIYLPIDAKFPLDDYRRLIDAYDTANSDLVKTAQKDLATKIKIFAKDIAEKYIDVPYTTEFGIMFLPVEGLYAEVVKLGLVEDLQRTYKINIAGPTTMAALLNSIQMGFKTLAIQKRSSEVWDVLAEVKKEFDTFGNVLDAARNKINQANDELEKLVGTRTRQIQRKLKDVSTYSDYGKKSLETEVLLTTTEE